MEAKKKAVRWELVLSIIAISISILGSAFYTTWRVSASYTEIKNMLKEHGTQIGDIQNVLAEHGKQINRMQLNQERVMTRLGISLYDPEPSDKWPQPSAPASTKKPLSNPFMPNQKETAAPKNGHSFTLPAQNISQAKPTPETAHW
jgi:hypothetical protein